MNSQKKVKAVILLAIVIAVALFVTIAIQLVNIYKVRKEVEKQQNQIELLEKKLDYYENKLPDSNNDVITGES